MPKQRDLPIYSSLFILSVAMLTAITFILSVNIAATQEKETTVKHAQMAYTDPSSGSDMYAQLCAACHGPGGKGDGPAAPEFKRPPTDLTLLAKNNHGKFPATLVISTLEFGPQGSTPAHGNLKMPVWGNLFRGMELNEATATLRKSNLTKYVESLQAK
jgi:mono/diheme cytochrome c family protein